MNASDPCPACRDPVSGRCDGRNHSDPPGLQGSESCPACGGSRRVPGPVRFRGRGRCYAVAGRAGCVQLQRARETGRLVGVYRNDQAGLDTDGGPWSTVCEEHGTVVAHDSLGLALGHAASPLGWCEDCIEADEAPRRRARAIAAALSTYEAGCLVDFHHHYPRHHGPACFGTDAPQLLMRDLVAFVRETRSGTTWFRLTPLGLDVVAVLLAMRRRAS